MGLADLTEPPASVVMGVDMSTQAIAFSIFRDGDLEHYGKLYLRGDNIFDKYGDANKKMYHVLKLYEPEVVLIEAAVFVNNRQVVKKLSGIIGAIGGVAAALGARVDEIAPVSWQTHIGNPLLKKDDKEKIKKANPKAKAAKLKTIGREQRKQKTMELIEEHYDVVVKDDDVADAIGVGWYAASVYSFDS